MAESDELPGRIVRIDRNFANISVSGRAGNSRLDRSVASRITGSYIADLRDILEMNAQLKVRVVPMSEEALSKFPQRIRNTVRRNSQWEVKFFKRDIEPAPQVLNPAITKKTLEIQPPSTSTRKAVQTAVASATGTSATGASATGGAVQKTIQTAAASATGTSATAASATSGAVQKTVQTAVASATGTSATGASATAASATGGAVQKTVQTAVASATGTSATGASATTASATGGAVQKTVQTDAASATGTSATGASATGSSATGGSVEFKDVLSRTQIIDSLEDCNRVLDPILDQSTRETVVIGLDCAGVNLGKQEGCLTLVQISTWDKKAFLFDAFKNPQLLKGNSSLKKILEHNSILKVIHFCKSDTYSLHHGFGVTLRNVFDTSIAINTLTEEMNMITLFHFNNLCKLVGVGGYVKDDDFAKKMRETPDFWKIRPLTEEMIYYAASDALCLVPRSYTKLEGYCKLLTPLQRALIASYCKDDVENIQLGNEQLTSESRLSCLKPHPPPFMINIEDSDDSYIDYGDDDPFSAYNSDDDYY